MGLLVAFLAGLGLGLFANRWFGHARISPAPAGGDDVFVAAGRVAAQRAGWQYRYRCGGCDLVTNMGGLGMHQKASGHVGRERVE